MFSIFLYGNLQFPTVQKMVLGRELTMKPAFLHGFSESVIDGLDYPIATAKEGASVKGFVAQVDAAELSALHEFDNSGPVANLFDNQEHIVIDECGALIPVRVGVGKKSQEHSFKPKKWDMQEYEKNKLPRFLQRIQQIYGGR